MYILNIYKYICTYTVDLFNITSVSDPGMHGSAKDLPPVFAFFMRTRIQLLANKFRKPKAKVLFKAHRNKNTHGEKATAPLPNMWVTDGSGPGLRFLPGSA